MFPASSGAQNAPEWTGNGEKAFPGVSGQIEAGNMVIWEIFEKKIFEKKNFQITMFPAISGAETPGNAFSPIPVHSGAFSEQIVPRNMVFSAQKSILGSISKSPK